MCTYYTNTYYIYTHIALLTWTCCYFSFYTFCMYMCTCCVCICKRTCECVCTCMHKHLALGVSARHQPSDSVRIHFCCSYVLVCLVWRWSLSLGSGPGLLRWTGWLGSPRTCLCLPAFPHYRWGVPHDTKLLPGFWALKWNSSLSWRSIWLETTALKITQKMPKDQFIFLPKPNTVQCICCTKLRSFNKCM